MYICTGERQLPGFMTRRALLVHDGQTEGMPASSVADNLERASGEEGGVVCEPERLYTVVGELGCCLCGLRCL